MMRFIKRLRFLFNIRKSVPFMVDFFRSKEVSFIKKVLSIGIVVVYFWLPFDLIPDVFVLFGIIDDVAVFTFVLQLIVKMAPEELKNRYEYKK
ncbi:YkvA family protein [Rossellomorea sp. NPDC071047]|uniref:YkvA family protein n=1 Tax=Rossellomorea sp. NPDC071047 TaxID=3390675 RepID=UPI003D03E0C5